MSTDYSEPAQDRAIDMSAAEFIERRDSRDWNERDDAELAEWLAQSTAHRVAFLRLNASWKRTERLVALRAPLPAIRPANDRSGGGLRLKYAAAAASLLLLGGLAAAYLSTPRYDTFSTPVGGREILTLRDGSRIELNTDTRIRVSRNSQERSIQLERGEVYFQVRHNAARPFVVTAQGHRMTDLGTRFSARIEGSDLKVALIEGSVKFEASDQARGNRPAVLSPGDVLMASTDAVSVKKEPLRDLMASLAWRQGMLVFHETALADAAREFNRYNQTKIVIRDPQAGSETINGMLPANNLDEFARMAKNLFGLHVERRENEILLTR